MQRSGDTSQSLSVYLDQGGVGTSPYQYVLSTFGDGNVAPGSPITIPAFFSSVTVTMTATDDSAVESTQDVTITIEANVNYTVGTPSTASLHILDNDSGGGGGPPGGGQTFGTPIFVPGLGIEVTPRRYLIAVDDERFVATDTAADFSVMANDIGAIQITGVSTPGKGLATIAGTTVHYVPSPSATGDDSFTYTVTDGSAHYDTATVRLKIGALDSVPLVTVSTPTPNATEPNSPTDGSGGISSFVFHRQGGDLQQPLTVRYSISGTTSRADIIAAPSPDLYRGEVTFAADEPTATIPFLPVYDTLREGTEVLHVAIKPFSSYRVGEAYFATVNINDPATGSVGNRAWADWNGNGSQDDEEPGLGGIKVTLIRFGSSGDETLADKSTLPSGSFEFTGLTPGALYRLKFEVVHPTQLGLFAFSPKWATSADKNSDVDPTTGQTDYFSVQDGEGNNDVDAGLVLLSDKPLGELVGPGAVPGLSTYTYSLRQAGNLTDVTWALQNLEPLGSSNIASFGSTTRTYDSGSNSTLLSVEVNFENTQPAKIRLSASRDGSVVATKDINLVQVILSDSVEEASFTPSTSTVYSSTLADTSDVSMVYAKSGTVPTAPGLRWAARVRLVGPGNNEGVNSIQVGYIQSVYLTQKAGHYLTAGSSSDRWLVSSMQGQAFLDAPGGGAVPWASMEPGSYISGQAGPVDQNIGLSDTPSQGVPAVWPQLDTEALGPNYSLRPDRISDMLLQLDFRLNVAASTSDNANAASSRYWGQAFNTWQYGGRGIVNDLGVSWSSASDIGVRTDGNSWKILLGRYEVPHGGPTANNAAQSNEHSFVPAPAP